MLPQITYRFNPLLKRLDRINDTFDFPNKTNYIELEASYSTNSIFKGILDRSLVSIVTYRIPLHKKWMFSVNKFISAFDTDIYICLIILLLFTKLQLVKFIKNIDF